MKSEYFRDGSQNGTYLLSVEENHVQAMPATECEQGIRITYTLSPSSPSTGQSWEPFCLSGTLKYNAGENVIFARGHEAQRDQTANRFLDFPLRPEMVEFVEAQRRGKNANVIMVIDGVFVVSRQAQIGISTPVVTQIIKSQVTLNLEIPKSVWEEKVLSGVGLNSMRAVEITIPPGLGRVFAEPLRELKDAEKALQTAASESEFEDVVGKARTAVEALINMVSGLDLPKREDGSVKSGFEAKAQALGRDQRLVGVLGQSNATPVASVMEGLWKPMSGADHPGRPKFERTYARFSVHLAATLISAVSDALGQQPSS